MRKALGDSKNSSSKSSIFVNFALKAGKDSERLMRLSHMRADKNRGWAIPRIKWPKSLPALKPSYNENCFKASKDLGHFI